MVANTRALMTSGSATAGMAYAPRGRAVENRWEATDVAGGWKGGGGGSGRKNSRWKAMDIAGKR